MKTRELIQWLRDNSAGLYRPAAEAAYMLERLVRKRDEFESSLAYWTKTLGEIPAGTDDFKAAIQSAVFYNDRVNMLNEVIGDEPAKGEGLVCLDCA